MRFDFFRAFEFRCRCGCGGGFADMDSPFLERLTIARWHAGVPFVLNSAFRCPAWNAHPDVGGEPDSYHLRGRAVDIRIFSDAHRSDVILGLIRAGFTGLGIYATFVHADDRGESKIWHG